MILLQVLVMSICEQCLYVALIIQGSFTHFIQALSELKQWGDNSGRKVKFVNKQRNKFLDPGNH